MVGSTIIMIQRVTSYKLLGVFIDDDHEVEHSR